MSRADGWYFVRIDDEWRPAEWLDGDWDLSPMMALLILEVDEDPISIAIHAENRQLRAKLAELESQAAIGRRAAEMLKDLEMSRPVIDANGFSGRGCLKCCGVRALGHKPGCELAAILRDAEQAQSSNGQGILDSSALEPATVAVDAGALAELREALRDLDDYWQHTPLMENNVMQHMASAARRLLAGIERQAAHDVTLTNEGNITDRQLADAVNELRDIAIKFHAAGQLRERIAGVVRGLVRGEPAAVAVDAGARVAADNLIAELLSVCKWIEKLPVPTTGASARLIRIDEAIEAARRDLEGRGQ